MVKQSSQLLSVAIASLFVVACVEPTKPAPEPLLVATQQTSTIYSGNNYDYTKEVAKPKQAKSQSSQPDQTTA